MKGRDPRGSRLAWENERAVEVLRASLGLGLTSFGGPIAHLGYFERTYVRERRWLSGAEYANLVALCQILPGPTSSQVGFLIGLHGAGWLGAVAAWLGFTLPSAVMLYACALFSTRLQGTLAQAGLHGLQLVTVAVVAQAVWSMARRLCPDRITATLAFAAAVLALVVGGTSAQLAALAIGAAGGLLWCRAPRDTPLSPLALPARTAWGPLSLVLILLLTLPILGSVYPRSLIALASVFYRSGALVFGGGHVVLPLLRDALVPTGWLSDERFLSGYGLAQAVPGPLFTVASYLGAESYRSQALQGALVGVFSIFLPGLLIAVAGVSLWSRLAHHARIRSAFTGINAVVVGILGAALYDPVWTTAVRNGTDAAIVVGGLLLLERWKAAPMLVVLCCVLCSCGVTLIHSFAP